MLRFINTIVNDFFKSASDLGDSHIIPPNLFKEQKPLILIEIQFCDRNENNLKDFHEKIS